MNIPKVFVSYSHDDLSHKQWVLDLATRLRNNGVDSIIDQWDLRPGDDLPKFMEQNLTKADYVIIICTEKYVEKANNGNGGVGYEKMILTADYLSRMDSRKVIPIVRNNPLKKLPIFMQSKLYIDFSREDMFEYSYDELVRNLHDAPLFEKPEIGNNPFKPIEEIRPNRIDDPLLLLMKFLIQDFEKHSKKYTLYSKLVNSIPMSRVYLDMVIKDAIDKNLVYLDNAGDVCLTEEGKLFGIRHRLLTEY